MLTIESSDTTVHLDASFGPASGGADRLRRYGWNPATTRPRVHRRPRLSLGCGNEHVGIRVRWGGGHPHLLQTPQRGLADGSVAWGGYCPGSTRGAWANIALPESVPIAVLALLIVVTGVVTLLRSPAVEHARHFEAPTLLAIGAFVGFGSALTGTGGPVLLIPILLLLRTPVRGAVGIGMAISLTVTVSSMLGYVYYGSVDFVLGTMLGLALVVGVMASAWIAHTVRVKTLQRIVAAALICIGLLIALQPVWTVW